MILSSLLVVLGFWLILAGLMRNTERVGFPTSVALGKGSLVRLKGGSHFLPEVSLPRLTGEMLADVLRRKGATAGSLDGWGWRVFKASLFPGLMVLLVFYLRWRVMGFGQGLLDDATPLGLRPVCVLPIAYRVGVSARMSQLEGWFRSWVPDSVLSAGGGRLGTLLRLILRTSFLV